MRHIRGFIAQLPRFSVLVQRRPAWLLLAFGRIRCRWPGLPVRLAATATAGPHLRVDVAVAPQRAQQMHTQLETESWARLVVVL